MIHGRMLAAVPAGLLLLGALAWADDGTQGDMGAVREALRANRRAVFEANLDMTDAEARAFWPIYARYQQDLIATRQSLFQVVEEETLQAVKLTDAKALDLVQRYLAAEAARVQVRSAYLKEIAQVLPGLKVARFFQIENKLDALIDYGMAVRVPLAKP